MKKATSKLETGGEIDGIKEIVTELTHEAAAAAEKKIAEWMKGDAEADEVVAALKKKSEAESKSIFVFYFVCKETSLT